MNSFLVTYDLRAPSRNYEPLWKRLGEWKAGRVLDSTWAIRAATTSEVLRDDLLLRMDGDDGLLVVEISYAAWRGLLQDPMPFLAPIAA